MLFILMQGPAPTSQIAGSHKSSGSSARTLKGKVDVEVVVVVLVDVVVVDVDEVDVVLVTVLVNFIDPHHT